MEPWLQTILAVVIAVIGSSGFWAYMMKRSDSNNAEKRMLIGLGHDRIVFLGMSYIERGYINQDEYENLYEYLYKPYEEMGGNGSAERVMKEVQKLPIHKSKYVED